MGFLNTNSMPRLVEKLADGDNIKITGNSKGNRVGTVIKKIVEKADDVTKAVEQEVVNNSYSFKVGTGNVDVSTDVEDGFGEVGIKGVTLQNCYPPLTTSNFSPLNGTITSDGYVSMQGDGANWKNAWIDINKCLIKPNTTYTLVCYVLENTLVEGLYLTTASNQCVFRATNKVPAKTTGLLCYIATTIGDFTSVPNGLRSYLSNTETGKIVFKVMVLEGDHTNNPNLPSYFEGIVGVGDKSKNLFNSLDKTYDKQWIESNGKLILSDAVGRTAFNHFIPCKPNTNYYFSSDTTIGLKGIFEVSDLEGNNCKLLKNTDATKESFTTTSSAKFIVIKANTIVSDNITIQLEEGSTATAYEPYYDGHKIEILSNGKNLFDIQRYLSDNVNSQYYKISADGGLEILKLDSRISFKNLDSGISVKRNTAYSIKCSLPWDSLRVLTQKNNVWSNIKPTNYQFYSGDSDMIYIKFVEEKNFPKIVTHIQVEESSTPSSYQPYFADKTQILLDEPLMRLPNGVHDEITRDGKLIRRVGKYTIDGSETWYQNSGMSSAEYLVMYTTSIKNINIIRCPKISNYAIIDNYPNNNYNYECMHFEHLSGSKTATALFLRLKVTSANDFVTKIKTNPIIFYYELETPIITELPAPYLRIFKDGHLTFNTLVAPESNHVVQLNKSAQIERSIREVQGLDSRVGQLESFYDDMMLETSHKLNLLTYDFEYTKESEDI